LRKRLGRIKEKDSNTQPYAQSLTATQSHEGNHVEEK
jgi:hypothetical protein